MPKLKTLIDKASEMCGGDSKLARRLGVSKQLVSLIRAGDRAMTPEMAAELADLLGEDAHNAVIEAILERNKGTARGSRLRAIFGKAANWVLRSKAMVIHRIGH